MNLNLVIGVVGFVLGLAFLTAWLKTRTNISQLIESIKNKPPINIDASLIDVGALQSDEAE